MNKPQWRPVVGYEGLYEVSSRGGVRRILYGIHQQGQRKELRPWLSSHGYRFVSLYKNKAVRKHRVHRLVAEAFLSPPAAKQVQVRHLDGTRTNNHVSNLAWGTASENMLDAVRHGTQFNHYRKRTHCKNGHEFTEENTLLANDGRRCKTCRRDRVRKWRKRHMEATA